MRFDFVLARRGEMEVLRINANELDDVEGSGVS